MNILTRKQIRLARSLERAAVPERPYVGRGPRYLVHPTITVACAPSLLTIAAALRNDPTAFSDDELKPVQSFITNGWSPFFGRDETAARREAVRLQHAVLDPKPAGSGRSQIEQADAEGQYQIPAPTSARGTITISTGTLLIAAMLVVAAIAAPAALGGPARSGHPVTAHQAATAGSPCPCNTGLPGGPSAAGHAPTATLVAAHQAATAVSPCPCNAGLPGGSSAARHAEGATLVPAHQTAPAGSPCPCNAGLPGGPKRSASN